MSQPHLAPEPLPAPGHFRAQKQEATNVQLDAEKLDVFRIAVEAQGFVSGLIPPEQRVLRDQLERASVSVVLVIAEGAGRRSRRDKRHYYAMARGSATECAAAIELLRRRGLASAANCARARSLYVRVVMMLTKLDASLA